MASSRLVLDLCVAERGAIWPNDAYVALELQRHSSAKISLKLKPVASQIEDDVEFFGKEGEDDDVDDEDDEQDFMKIAEDAENDLLLAQAKGVASELTNKQKLAIRKKLA